VNIILRARDSTEGAAAADVHRRAPARQARGNFRVLGPAFAPLARLRQEHRFQVLLKGRARRCGTRCERAGRALRQRALAGVAVDVDPVTIM
jgi:primosomal protein N'